MEHNIVFVYHDEIGKQLAQLAKDYICEHFCAHQFDFSMQEVANNLTTDDSNDIIKRLSRADAILLLGDCKVKQGEFCHSIQKSLNLYASAQCFCTPTCKDLWLVKDCLGGIYFSQNGFRQNSAFGREAFDEECYSELEIERTARVAYDFAMAGARRLTLVDMANHLCTSKLWRKITTDINEDYPFVNLQIELLENMLKNGLPDFEQTLVTSNMFGDILSATLHRTHLLKATAFVGDTNLCAISCEMKEHIPFACDLLLKKCFDIKR